MKKLILGFCVAIILSSFAHGDAANKISLGYLRYGTQETATVALRPDFKLGAWSLGLDVNIPLTQNTTSYYDQVVFRYAEYNDGLKGLRYGMVDNVTWGRGLLMKNYSSRISGSIVQSNQQMCLGGFLTADRVKFQFLNTWSHIYALRLTEQAHPMLTLGQSYITDADGVAVVQPNGARRQYPSVSQIAVDAAVPLPLNFEGYVEAAQMINYGNAMTFGVNWAADALVFAVSFDAGYRAIDKKFVPGYFNANYETNPVDLASYEAGAGNKNGYVAELKALAGELFKLNLLYENYNGSNAAFNGETLIALQNMELQAAYNQPNFVDFRSLDLQQGAIIRTSAAYKLNPNTAVVLHYKRVFDPAIGQVVGTQYYEMKFTLP